MATKHFDPSASAGGNGDILTPYRFPAEYSPSPFDVLNLKGGQTFGVLPENWSTTDDITIQSYGTGRAIISGGVIKPAGAWTSAGGGVYWTTVTNGGHVLRNGFALRVAHWGIDTTSTMPTDSFMLDPWSNPMKMYIKISGALTDYPLEVSDVTLRASDISAGRTGREEYMGSLWASFGSAPKRVKLINLHFRCASRHHVDFPVEDGVITRCLFEWAGGQYNRTWGYWLGNCIEITGKGRRTDVYDNELRGAYDSGYTAQNYDGFGTVLNGWKFRGNKVSQCGLAAVEISTQAADGGQVRDGLIYDNDLFDNGPYQQQCSSWANSQNNVGYAINLQSNGGANVVVTGIRMELNRMRDNRGGIQAVSKTAASHWYINNTMWSTRQRQLAGIYEQFFASSTHGAYGNLISNFADGISCESQGGTLSLQAGYMVLDDCTTAVRRANNAGVVLRNSTVQRCGTVATGSVGTLTGLALALNNTSDGTYTRSPSDFSLPAAVALSAAPDFLPPPGSLTYSGGVDTGILFPGATDKYGQAFGSGSTWARGAVAKYPSTTPSPTPGPAPTPAPGATPKLISRARPSSGQQSIFAASPAASKAITVSPTVGNVLVVGTSTFDGRGLSAVSVTDNGSTPNDYTPHVDNGLDTYSSTNNLAALHVAKIVNAPTTVTVGVEVGARLHACAVEFTNVDTSILIRDTGTLDDASGDGGTWTSDGGAAKVGDVIVLQLNLQDYSSAAPSTFGIGFPSDWTVEFAKQDSAEVPACAMAWGYVTADGPQSVPITWSSLSSVVVVSGVILPAATETIASPSPAPGVVTVPTVPVTAAGANGRRRPRLLGRVYNITPILIDAGKLIYQLNDGGIEGPQIYDRGVPLASGTVHTNLYDFTNVAPAAGTFSMWKEAGVVRLGSSPSGQVTADAWHSIPTGSTGHAYVAKLMADLVGLVQPSLSVSTADVAALNALAPYSGGIWIDDDTTALEALSKLAVSIGAWFTVDPQGVMRMGRIEAPAATAVLSLTPEVITGMNRMAPREAGADRPVWQVRLHYKRNHTLQASDIATSVSLTRRADLSREYWAVAVASDTTIRARNPLARVMNRYTVLDLIGDAQAEALRLLDLFKVARDVWQISAKLTPLQIAALRVGSTIQITHPRQGFSAGRRMVVLGMVRDLKTSVVTFTVWG